MAKNWSNIILLSIFKIAHLNFAMKFMSLKIAHGTGVWEPKYPMELKRQCLLTNNAIIHDDQMLCDQEMIWHKKTCSFAWQFILVYLFMDKGQKIQSFHFQIFLKLTNILC